MYLKLRDTLQPVYSSKVCISPNELLLQLCVVKLHSRPHRYPVSLSKIPKFFIRPILQCLLHTIRNSQTQIALLLALTLKEGCSLSKVSKATTLQEVITRFSVARLLHCYFSPQSPNLLRHLTLEIGFFYSLTCSNGHFQFLLTETLTTSHVLLQGLKQNLSRCVILQHDNATSHSARRPQVMWQSFHWQHQDHQPLLLKQLLGNGRF
jgi:hypothetical protein